MTIQNCELLLRQLRRQLEDALEVRSLDREACVLQIPFFDHGGDPLRVVVRQTTNQFIVDDGGTIAGHLFSVGQHAQDTPAYKLLDALIKAYEFEFSLDDGSVKGTAQEYDVIGKVLDLAKVMITIVTATPHMRVRAHRLRRFGPRVRAKVKQDYAEQGILSFVEPYYELPGTAVELWPIDFHWQVRRHGEIQNVYVLAVDLDVAEPLRKVEYLTALAVDVRGLLNGSSLRVVADTHGQNSAAQTSMKFLQQHRSMLGYMLFDFGKDIERQQFNIQSKDEILSEAGREWRIFWQERPALF